jgi:predicted nucleic acid binding AN1-type Zn finger protein
MENLTNIKKCKICKKNINLMNFQCKSCNIIFCINHRTPEDHNCEKLHELHLKLNKINQSNLYNNKYMKDKIIKI